MSKNIAFIEGLTSFVAGANNPDDFDLLEKCHNQRSDAYDAGDTARVGEIVAADPETSMRKRDVSKPR